MSEWYQRKRIWHKTALATFYPLVANSLSKSVKMCNSSKKLNTLAACLTLDIHTHTVNVCSTNSSASNDVPVPLVSPPQGGGWKGQWRRSSGGRVERVDPKELITFVSVDTLGNEEQDHSCSKVLTRRVSAAKLACYSICLGPRTEKPLMAPQVASQHKSAARQRGLQQVSLTCRPCQGPANMKHSCV